MDASRAPLRGERRAACLVLGLLCALGILTGAVLRGAEVSAHHHHHPAVTASATTVTDGPGASARGDHHLIATAAVTTTVALDGVAATDPARAALPATSVEVVRTRGPPAGA